jgi:hypothetical protein
MISFCVLVSAEQRPSWEADGHLISIEIPRSYEIFISKDLGNSK